MYMFTNVITAEKHSTREYVLSVLSFSDQSVFAI